MTTASTRARALPPAREPATEQLPPSLRSFALAAVGTIVRYPAEDVGAIELQYLLGHVASVAPSGPPWFAQLATYLARPAEADRPLLALGRDLNLTTAELLAAALAAAVEDDLMAGRAVAYLQAPIAGSRPTLGLLATAFATLPDGAAAADEIAAGSAARSGLLALQGEGPLQERVVSMPPPIALALRGVDTDWPGISIGTGRLPETPLAASILDQAARHARALAAASARALAVRSGSTAEARAVACAIAAKLHRRAAFIRTDRIAGLGPWLTLRGLVPVFLTELAPGEHHTLPDIAGYHGAVLALCGPDGTIEARGEATASWRVPTPSRDERAALWEFALSDSGLARDLATDHRHSSGRIAELGRIAHHLAMLDGRLTIARRDVTSAARVAETQLLGALAQSIPDDVPDAAMVAPPALRTDLEALLARCRAREALVDGLGPAARARYHPGVRALFVGPSGTGKTLAASWLASRLGIPLYRVDLASITSKYIGETEKNLAQLIARAEHAEIALLFDEADSLFGKRTDVKDSNDRFANAQTNYLLQRIETFDGIAILTSNSRARFDSAFSRRLDAIIEFPAPGPEERRALWLAHLGDGHALSAGDINQIAATADLAGGHIRNAVLAAATAAGIHGRPIGHADVVVGVAAEYRKLGRQVPAGLGTRGSGLGARQVIAAREDSDGPANQRSEPRAPSPEP
jgi:hypothetical protein